MKTKKFKVLTNRGVIDYLYAHEFLVHGNMVHFYFKREYERNTVPCTDIQTVKYYSVFNIISIEEVEDK